jgi:hypothetical protein
MKAVTIKQKEKLRETLLKNREELRRTVKELDSQVLDARQQANKCKTDILHLLETSAEAIQVANQSLPFPN